MADLGLHGTPERTAGDSELDHYRACSRPCRPQFSTVWISDHLQFGDEPVREAWTLLTYLAATFPRYRYGQLVLCQSYRNPRCWRRWRRRSRS